MHGQAYQDESWRTISIQIHIWASCQKVTARQRLGSMVKDFALLVQKLSVLLEFILRDPCLAPRYRTSFEAPRQLSQLPGLLAVKILLITTCMVRHMRMKAGGPFQSRYTYGQVVRMHVFYPRKVSDFCQCLKASEQAEIDASLCNVCYFEGDSARL